VTALFLGFSHCLEGNALQSSSRVQYTAAGGAPVVSGPSFKICAVHSMFGPRLLHTSNIVFKKCGSFVF